MSCRALVALALLGAGPGFAEPSTENIDFHDTYEASKGERELATEQYKQAYGTYSRLAAETSNPGLATVAWARAAVALGLQEGMYEQGLERARAITNRPCSVQVQMQLMVANEDYQKLLDAFADEDIAVWPKRTLPKLWHFGRQDLRALALADRARAYLETGNAEAAVRDAEKALEFADGERHKLEILSFLGSHVYRRTLRALEKPPPGAERHRSNVKMCESNPDIVPQWLADVEEGRKQNPNNRVFNVSPLDGWTRGHCICENCRAWDHLDGAIRSPFIWEGMAQEYVALTDRDVKFANRLARSLKERFPDKELYVYLLAYGHSRPAR